MNPRLPTRKNSRQRAPLLFHIKVVHCILIIAYVQTKVEHRNYILQHLDILAVTFM